MDRVRQAAAAVVGDMVWAGEVELDAAMALRSYLSAENLAPKQVFEAVTLFMPHQADLVLQRMQYRLDETEPRRITARA